MQTQRKDRVGVVLLLWLVGSLTVGLQAFVGHATIYASDLEQKRLLLHESILSNRPPAGQSWDAAGALSSNVRVGAIYLAQGIHRITGLSVSIVYVLLDTVSLFAALIAIFFYLRKWLPDTYCSSAFFISPQCCRCRISCTTSIPTTGCSSRSGS